MSGNIEEREAESSDNDSVDLEMDYSSLGASDADLEGKSENRGAEFGMYEPIVSQADLLAQHENPVVQVDIDERRRENTDWCKCADHCRVLPSFKAGDCICCREIPEVTAEADQHNVTCITIAEGFAPAILHPLSLYIGWSEYTDKWRREAKSFHARNNEKYRYVAYRKLVRWCWGWLGKDIRVQLPACAHARIMQEYPDQGGQYTGTILRRWEVE